MSKILYVTTNEDKFNKAKINLEQYGIELKQQSFEMLEIQTSNGEKIVRHKAKQAYEYFKKPVLVNDDTWSIPALRGFPSTGMKFCNDFLLAKDWLRLMKDTDDRRVFLISYYAYHNGISIKVIKNKDERYFLNKAQDNNPKAPCLEVIAKKGSDLSIAKQITLGREIEKNNSYFWKKLAKILNNK